MQKLVEQRSVMVVEDNDDFRQVLCQFLRFYGFDPILDAPDGQAAWERLREGPVDLLITDINMPRLSGLDLIRLVRGLHPLLPILVITGYQHELHHLAALDIQATLIKPFKMPLLDAEIRRIFGQGGAA